MVVSERPALLPVICDGRTKDGRPCKRILLEALLAPGSVIEKICDRCGKRYHREV